MKSIDIIQKMSNVDGAPGFEDKVIAQAKEILDNDFVLNTDLMNNTKVTLNDFDATKPYIGLDAHMDEVALMIQAITDKGLLKVINLGGWDMKNLISQKVRMTTTKGDSIKGVISSVPVHFLSPDKRNSVPDIKDILVDVGASTKKEVLEMGIEIGLPLIPDAAFEYQKSNDVLIGKAFDDRMGCSLVIDTLNTLKSEGVKQVMGILSTQEEMGLRGARVLANDIAPKFIVAFEGTPADDTFKSSDEAQSVLGKGVQMRIADSSMIANPKLIAKIRAIAEEKGIKHQIAVRRGGGTNAGMYQVVNGHTPTIVLGVPVRYIHAHYGIAKLEDYNSAKSLAIAVAKAFEQGELNF